MIGRKASAVMLAALGISATGIIAPVAPKAETAQAAVRYPAYPVAKRIEPIVPPRTVQATVRKGVTTASAPKKIAVPQKSATKTATSKATSKAAAAKSAPPGKSALGGPLPAAKTVKPVARQKPVPAKR